MEGGENFFKKLLLWLKEPKPVIICFVFCVTVVSIAGALAVVFLNYAGVGSYVLYAVAALSLAYSVYIIVKFSSVIKKRITMVLKRKKFVKKYLEEFTFRTFVTSIISLIIDLGFVAFNTVFAIINKSFWFGMSAVYYLFLSSLKSSVFFADKKLKQKVNREQDIMIGQLKNYRRCGIVLLVVDLAMTGVVTLMILRQSPIKYSEIVAIVLAAYTCYRIAISIVNVVQARTHNDLQIQSFRNLGLAESALALVSLQMALVSTFSDGTTDMTILNAIVGFVACAFTIGLGIIMIIKATCKIKNINDNNKEKKNECD